MQDTGYWMEESRCWMQDRGCRIQDTGWKMPDAGLGILDGTGVYADKNCNLGGCLYAGFFLILVQQFKEYGLF